MADIVIEKLNNTFIKIHAERNILAEINDHFSFFSPGYQFKPAYRKRLWNGKTYLFKTAAQTLYYGLTDHLLEFCNSRKYSFLVDDRTVSEDIPENMLDDFIKNLKLPYELKDYQDIAFKKSAREKRCLTVSATGSGKSLLLYLICRYYTDKKILLIVPTVNLVTQMHNDFKAYSVNNKFDVDKNVHKIYSGQEKQSSSGVYISTYHSLHPIKNKEYFEQFDCVIVDEAHGATAESIKDILEKCTNASLRFGTTGTLRDSKCHHYILEGLIGKAFTASNTADLMNKNQLADLTIKCIMLKYSEEECKQNRKLDYNAEIDFIISHKRRNKFITKLALSLNDNTMILFSRVEKHGKLLYADILQQIQEKNLNKKVFYVSGETSAEIREEIRQSVETEKNAIIVGSVQVFSTGVNIKNLENLIFASPSKSKIRTLQSIGRILRIGRSDSATLYDIVDDMTIKNHKNFAYKHFVERASLYIEEKFKFKILKVRLFETIATML